MTGWRVGWMIGPARRRRPRRRTCSRTRRSNVANVSQRAALAAVTGDLDAVATMRQVFERRGAGPCTSSSPRSPESAASSLRAPSTASPPSRGCSDARSAGRTPTTTLELCELVLEEVGVAIVPGEAFGAPGYARLSFALADEDLVEGIERLAKLLG